MWSWMEVLDHWIIKIRGENRLVEWKNNALTVFHVRQLEIQGNKILPLHSII